MSWDCSACFDKAQQCRGWASPWPGLGFAGLNSAGAGGCCLPAPALAPGWPLPSPCLANHCPLCVWDWGPLPNHSWQLGSRDTGKPSTKGKKAPLPVSCSSRWGWQRGLSWCLLPLLLKGLEAVSLHSTNCVGRTAMTPIQERGSVFVGFPVQQL